MKTYYTKKPFDNGKVLNVGNHRPPHEMASFSIEIPFAGASDKVEIFEQSADELFKFVKANASIKYVYFFTANPVDQPDSRIVRHYGYAKSLGVESLRDEVGNEYIESTILPTSEGLRFTALIPIKSASSLSSVVDLARRGHSFLVMSHVPQDESDLESLFISAYGKTAPYNNRVCWEGVLNHVSLNNSLVVRISGMFDDPELGVDVFANSVLLEELIM